MCRLTRRPTGLAQGSGNQHDAARNGLAAGLQTAQVDAAREPTAIEAHLVRAGAVELAIREPRDLPSGEIEHFERDLRRTRQNEAERHRIMKWIRSARESDRAGTR